MIYLPPKPKLTLVLGINDDLVDSACYRHQPGSTVPYINATAV